MRNPMPWLACVAALLLLPVSLKIATAAVGKSPGAGPTTPPQTSRPHQQQQPEKSSSDELRSLPAIVGVILAGRTATHAVTIPSTALLQVTLFSSDAHLSLLDPRGSLITIRDTSEVRGVSAFTVPGFRGFRITEPQSGVWKIRIDASASDSAVQHYGCIIEFASPWAARLSSAQVVAPGSTLRVRAEVTNGTVRRPDARWRCSVLDPDRSVRSLLLFDDGQHGDAGAKDGIFGGSMVPASAGIYELLGVATVPGVGDLTDATTCEAVPYQDLSVASSDLRFSNDSPMAYDSVAIFATVHNHSTIPASDVDVTIRAVWKGETRGVELGSSKVDLPAGGAATVQVGWSAWALDSIRIRAEVSPYVLDEADYANNVASRPIEVRPRPVFVPGARSGAKFDEPRVTPGRTPVVIAFRLRRPSSARLSVRDRQGHKLREWQWPTLSAGSHSVVWDRRDSLGVRAAAGSYRCVLLVDGDWIPQPFQLGD